MIINQGSGKENLKTELTEQDTLLEELGAILDSKDMGALPELENPATAENIQKGYQIWDANGSLIVGEHECESAEDSGNTSIETCTVIAGADEAYSILGVQMINGIPYPIYKEDSYTGITWEAPCGSIVAIAYGLGNKHRALNMTYLGVDNGTYTKNNPPQMGYISPIYLFRIDAKVGETARVEMYEFDVPIW